MASVCPIYATLYGHQANKVSLRISYDIDVIDVRSPQTRSLWRSRRSLMTGCMTSTSNWLLSLIPANTTRGSDSMLVQCWTTVADGGPTLNQHRIYVSCFLGNEWRRDNLIIILHYPIKGPLTTIYDNLIFCRSSMPWSLKLHSTQVELWSDDRSCMEKTHTQYARQCEGHHCVQALSSNKTGTAA